MSKVGGEVQSYCTSCKNMREHIVVAMVGVKPAKVECDVCHRQHNYRAGPPGTSTRRSAAKPSGRAARSVAARRPLIADLDARVAGLPQREYDPNALYGVAEVIRHPSFGVGLVLAVPGPRKIEVAFEGGSKILVHERTAGAVALERPPPRDDNGERNVVTDAPPPPPRR